MNPELITKVYDLSGSQYWCPSDHRVCAPGYKDPTVHHPGHAMLISFLLTDTSPLYALPQKPARKGRMRDLVAPYAPKGAA